MSNKVHTARVKRKRNRWVPWFLILGGIVFCFSLEFNPEMYIGLFYPAVDFSVRQQGVSGYQAQNDEKETQNDSDEEYFGFVVSYRQQTWTSYTQWAEDGLSAKEPHDRVQIKRMSYAWKGGTGTIKGHRTEIGLRSIKNDRGYHFGYFGYIFPTMNFSKIFKGAQPGDEFEFQIIVTYAYDDEPDRTQVLDFHVKAFTPRRYYGIPLLPIAIG